MSIPNFSEMTHEALMEFWLRYCRPSRQSAQALVGNRRPGYVKVAETLANYACNLAVRNTCASKGDENGVAVYGHSMQLCLDKLPPEVREAVKTQRVAV